MKLYGLFNIKNKSNTKLFSLRFKSLKLYSTLSGNLNDYRKHMRDSYFNRKKEENKILQPEHKIEKNDRKEAETIKEAFYSELQSPQDLSIDIRARGKFERNPEDKNSV
jgi:hypothetical protein